MAPFDRSHTTFCWSAIVDIALSCTVFFSYLTLNNIVTLKSGLEVTQRHLNWYRSKDWVLFLFAFHSNYGRIFNRLMVYSTSKYSVTFKTGLGVVQGH